MELTPRQVVKELDRYIIGQDEAKRAVAIALRNRYRRRMLPKEVKEEITPKNIIMKGPTGVGKTEIARRLSKLVKAPFIKVEATKFTEVGYVGKDVEGMIRDLVEVSMRLVNEEKLREVEPRAREAAENKMVNAILQIKRKTSPDVPEKKLRTDILDDLRAGRLDNVPVEIEVEEEAKTLQLGPMGFETPGGNLGEIMGGFLPRRKRKRKVTVKEALDMFTGEEAGKLIDKDAVKAEALARVEEDGIIFIDEIDKVTSSGRKDGPDVSREGVQRDILPIIEGCTVNTRYGNVRTDFILFIASGAFHVSKVSDLIPELQGRFPVMVDLQSLTEEDFVKILTKIDNALIMQYTELLKVDGVDLTFTKSAVAEIAHVAFLENQSSENIGARRLHAVMEALLEDESFNVGNGTSKKVVVDKEYVRSHLKKTLNGKNLEKYIL